MFVLILNIKTFHKYYVDLKGNMKFQIFTSEYFKRWKVFSVMKSNSPALVTWSGIQIFLSRISCWYLVNTWRRCSKTLSIDVLCLRAFSINVTPQSNHLGDIFSSKGDSLAMIEERVKGSVGSAIELISLGKEVQFGDSQINNMLLLYQSTLLPR